MKLLVVFLAFISLATFAIGEEVEDVFGAGVFDTKWGDSMSDVQAIFPEGAKKSYGKISHYQILDGRTVLGIEREEEDVIVFAFDSANRLISVGVHYDGYLEITNLMGKLDTLFGKHTDREVEGASAPIKEWVGKGVSLSLILLPGMFTTKTVFGIEYTGPEKPANEKEDLGF